jgi:hypothetical protein
LQLGFSPFAFGLFFCEVRTDMPVFCLISVVFHGFTAAIFKLPPLTLPPQPRSHHGQRHQQNHDDHDGHYHYGAHLFLPMSMDTARDRLTALCPGSASRFLCLEYSAGA